MTGESPYERILQESLKGELRVLNAHLPRELKSLHELLAEPYPHVVLSDGSTHLFKRRELEYLAGLLDETEQKSLLLPILIELGAGDEETRVICRHGVEEKVVTRILEMPLTSKEKKILIYRPQLAVLRKHLKTTTQYIFSAQSLA